MKDNPKVLVVGGIVAFRRMEIQVLKTMGITRIKETDNEMQAVHTMIENPDLDIIILNVDTTGSKGHKTVTSLKKLNAKVPIVMISAALDKSTILQFIKAGVSDILTKPFPTRSLIKAVTDTLNNSEQENKNAP